ncbi:uncharacterized protein LOC125759920 [Rhipicephalus sanguineus]|uniref:uncharacterized protein LOC125759920 n=1 Tax=Rhipicephalus sanguineus TaxID=34632 RepID=UPI0020C34DF9|nr:uncharacterized protein LOC125759920 [Rhipicephalus sanguineus]
MKEAQDWVRAIAAVMTIATFVGSLTVADQIWHARSSSGIEYFPLGLGLLCRNTWMLYGYTAGEYTVMCVNACGFALAVFISREHRAFSPDTKHDGTVMLWLVLMNIFFPWSSAVELGKLAVILAVISDLQPVLRICRKAPLPYTAAWTLATSGLWTLYGVLSWNECIFLGHIVGVLVAAAELILAVWV